MKQPGICPAVLFVAKPTVSSIAASLNQQMVDSCIVSVNQSGWHKIEPRSMIKLGSNPAFGSL